MVEIIGANTVWAANSVHTLYDTVQIAPGATLTIEPGAIVRGGRLEAFGRLDVAGAAGSEVVFENVAVALKGSYQQPAQIDMAHVVMKGGSFHSAGGGADYGSFHLSDSSFEGVQSSVYVWYPTSDVLVERNVFVDSGGFSVGTNGNVQVVFRNNVFIRQTSGFAIENWASYESSKTIVESNSFLSTDRVALQIKPGGYDQARMTAENNYFGSSDAAVIGGMVRDRLDSLNYASVIDTTPHLSAPSPGTPVVVNVLTTASDQAKSEKATGATAFTFWVSLDRAANIAQTVQWEAMGAGVIPATAADFVGGVLPSGTIIFAPGETRLC